MNCHQSLESWSSSLQESSLNTLKFKFLSTIVGTVRIVVSDKELVAILWDNEKPNRVILGRMEEDLTNSLILEVEKQLKQYFKGQRRIFDLPLRMNGTVFQNAVWEELKKIPFGVIVSYKDIAQNLNKTKAVRAVGAANGRNPISIIVPCHRVIGADGKLSGFAGGVDRKRILLNLERSISL
jgi:methylated-DNA-[protein]-cysteine S-methyltransferase